MPLPRIATLAVLVAAPIALAASPAVAATAPLPDTDSLYAIVCHDTPQLFEVDPADASWVAVGPANAVGTSGCAYQSAFDPTTGRSYFLAGNTPDGYWPLTEIDTATGQFTIIHTVWDGTTEFDFNTEFPGSMLITSAGVGYLVAAQAVYPLDLETGVIGAQIGPDLSVSSDIYSTACSPVDPVCYALTENGELYELDPATSDMTSLGTLPFAGNYSLQVASDGTLWASSDYGNVSSFSADDPAGTYEQAGATPLYSGSYLITTPVIAPAPGPGPALAATGSDGVGLAAAAAALLAAGAALAVARRRSRSAA